MSFGLRGPRKKKATYRKRDGNEQYTLARFDPVLLDVMEDALAGKLNQDEYPYVRWVWWPHAVTPISCGGPYTHSIEKHPCVKLSYLHSSRAHLSTEVTAQRPSTMQYPG